MSRPRKPADGGAKRSRSDRSRSDRSRSDRRGSGRKRQGRKQGGDSPGGTYIKGRHTVEALLVHTPQRISALHAWRRDRAVAAVVEQARGLGIEVITAPPGDVLADDHLAQGLAARVSPYPYADLARAAPPAEGRPLVLVLDSITDPRNLGAILRSAAFFAVAGVILPRDRACPVSPAVERISRGATAIVPIARVTNLARTIDSLRERGYIAAATVLADDAVPLMQAQLSPPIALVLGGEGRGVRRLVAERCDLRTTLPATGPMQSLNVASFATLAMAACRGFRAADSA